MEVKVAENAGTCFGVANAIKIAFNAAKEYENIYITGELVHNPYVVEKLKKSGVKNINDIKKLKRGDNLIIRAHGESREVYDICEKKGINIIDCTCPFVKKAQSIATLLESKDYKVIIIGDPEHPEVRGIVAQTKDASVIQSPEEVDKKNSKFGKVGILSQTTQTITNFSETVAKIVSLPKIIKVYNTICTATEERQNSAKKLAKRVDKMIVIGGKNSANTKKLYEICNNIVDTAWVCDESEIIKDMIENKQKIGITAGASTPKEIIEKVKEKISTFN
ncbi:MAG: 4-hydroxy-3-methylbut-2-enyl diphosphate reductase [Nanobdellota archaeon]